MESRFIRAQHALISHEKRKEKTERVVEEEEERVERDVRREMRRRANSRSSKVYSKVVLGPAWALGMDGAWTVTASPRTVLTIGIRRACCSIEYSQRIC